MVVHPDHRCHLFGSLVLHHLLHLLSLLLPLQLRQEDLQLHLLLLRLNRVQVNADVLQT